MSMNKRWIYLILTVAGACIAAVALIYLTTRWIEEEEQKKRESTRIQLEEEEDYRYRVTSYRGHIGIYDAQGYLKSEVIVAVDQLPMADQKKLQEGILVKSQQELYALMEDYTG